MNILILGVAFPRPNNRRLSTWALAQAQQLHAAGHRVRSVVLYSWVPKIAARSPGARRWVECPGVFDFDGVETFYERGPYYYSGRLRGWTARHPRLALRLAWPWLGRHLAWHVDAFKPDVIFAHHAAVGGLAALMLQRRRRVPFVVIDHDNDEMAQTEAEPERRGDVSAVWRAAGASIGITQQMTAQIARIEPAARVATLPHGFDLPVATRAPDQRTDDTITVLCIAGFFERKNIPTLVRAFARAAARHPAARLRLGGDGDQLEMVRGLIAELGLADRVTLLGPVQPDEVMREMAAADVFALVSYNEPFGVVYVEAMAHGLPVVCGDDGGINDLVENDVQALCVPPRDVEAVAAALERLFATPATRARLGAAGRALYESKLTGAAWGKAAVALFDQARVPQ